MHLLACITAIGAFVANKACTARNNHTNNHHHHHLLQIHSQYWRSVQSLSLNGWMDAIKQHQEASSEEDDEEEGGSAYM